MSWVSQANIKNIMTAIRNKFTTGDLVIANDAKDTGVELNHTAQDGLVTVSPISTSASTEAALHLSNGDDTKKTELTQGTLSYVDSSSGTESYNYMSLLGDAVTFGKNGGGNVQVGGVADPTSEQQVATKNYVDSKILFKTVQYVFGEEHEVAAGYSKYSRSSAKTFTLNVKNAKDLQTALTRLSIECIPVNGSSSHISGFSNLKAFVYNPKVAVDAENNIVTVTVDTFIIYNPYSESASYGDLLIKVWYYDE